MEINHACGLIMNNHDQQIKKKSKQKKQNKTKQGKKKIRIIDENDIQSMESYKNGKHKNKTT